MEVLVGNMVIIYTTSYSWDWIAWSPHCLFRQLCLDCLSPHSPQFCQWQKNSVFEMIFHVLLVRTLHLEPRAQLWVRGCLVPVANKTTFTLPSVWCGFHQSWQDDASLLAGQQSWWLSKDRNLSVNDRAGMAPALSAFKSLPSHLAWVVEILAFSLTSESAKKQPFCVCWEAQWVIGIHIKITCCFMMCGLMKVLNYSKW